MNDITFQHVVILSELLLCGAKNNFVELTTGEIAKKNKTIPTISFKRIT
jgi:hypothetical protein